jgi:hypothetical protein
VYLSCVYIPLHISIHSLSDQSHHRPGVPVGHEGRDERNGECRAQADRAVQPHHSRGGGVHRRPERERELRAQLPAGPGQGIRPDLLADGLRLLQVLPPHEELHLARGGQQAALAAAAQFVLHQLVQRRRAVQAHQQGGLPEEGHQLLLPRPHDPREARLRQEVHLHPSL